MVWTGQCSLYDQCSHMLLLSISKTMPVSMCWFLYLARCVLQCTMCHVSDDHFGCYIRVLQYPRNNLNQHIGGAHMQTVVLHVQQFWHEPQAHIVEYAIAYSTMWAWCSCQNCKQYIMNMIQDRGVLKTLRRYLCWSPQVTFSHIFSRFSLKEKVILLFLKRSGNIRH